MIRIIGLDPGLQHTGWGVIESEGNRLRAVACGVLSTSPADSLARRLAVLFQAASTVFAAHQPMEAAVEESFLNKNPASTLKLGHARAISLLLPALNGIAVHEYSARLVKKAVVGTGAASKEQVELMVGRLLPGMCRSNKNSQGPAGGKERTASLDASDALAVAICHAHHRQSHAALASAREPMRSPPPQGAPIR